MKVTRISLFILIYLFLGLPSVVQAIEVKGLYEAELPVVSQGRTERKKAIRTALAGILVKVTGNSQIALSPGIPELLDRSDQLLQQYRYRILPADDQAPDNLQEQLLWMQFNQIALDKALREIMVPVWGRSRPSTLLWLAVEPQGQPRQLLGADDDAPILQQILTLAEQRGIPLDLPLLDLVDQQQIVVSEVWAGFQDSILRASVRYPVEAVLVGRLRELPDGRWQGRWSFYQDGQTQQWQPLGLLSTVISEGIEGTALTLVSRYVSRPDRDPGELQVLVKDIRSLSDYARSERYLQALDAVIDAQPIRIDADRILYNVRVRGDRDSLLQAVQLSSQPVLVNEKIAPPNQQVAVLPLEGNPPGTEKAAPPDIIFRLLE